MECTRCSGHGFVMTRDTGVCGTEEYGTCGLCRGIKELPPELEALHNKIAELEKLVASSRPFG